MQMVVKHVPAKKIKMINLEARALLEARTPLEARAKTLPNLNVKLTLIYYFQLKITSY